MSHHSSSMLSDKSIFKTTRQSFRELRRASQVLAELQRSLDTKVFFMRKSLLPSAHHYGIYNLPNDVLMQVIECCVDSVPKDSYRGFLEDRAIEWTFDSVRKLALISRTFRDAVYATSSCWSSIFLGEKNTARLLQMSKGAPLHSELGCHSLGSLFQNSPRCSSISH